MTTGVFTNASSRCLVFVLLHATGKARSSHEMTLAERDLPGRLLSSKAAESFEPNRRDTFLIALDQDILFLHHCAVLRRVYPMGAESACWSARR